MTFASIIFIFELAYPFFFIRFNTREKIWMELRIFLSAFLIIYMINIIIQAINSKPSPFLTLFWRRVEKQPFHLSWQVKPLLMWYSSKEIVSSRHDWQLLLRSQAILSEPLICKNLFRELSIRLRLNIETNNISTFGSLLIFFMIISDNILNVLPKPYQIIMFSEDYLLN